MKLLFSKVAIQNFLSKVLSGLCLTGMLSMPGSSAQEFSLPTSGQPGGAHTINAHGTRRDSSYVVYIPDGCGQGQKYPCLFVLSPNGRGDRGLAFVKAACDRFHWIYVSPENRGAPLPFLALDPMMQDVLNSAIRDYPIIDARRIYSCGYAGGAMEAQHLAVLCPDKIAGVIANCGIIHGAGMQDPNYPSGKVVVFLASPKDGRYLQMKDNAEFLKAHNWTTQWIEFEGGHVWAPPEVYAMALGWLDKNGGSTAFNSPFSSSGTHHFAPSGSASTPEPTYSSSPGGF